MAGTILSFARQRNVEICGRSEWAVWESSWMKFNEVIEVMANISLVWFDLCLRFGKCLAEVLLLISRGLALNGIRCYGQPTLGKEPWAFVATSKRWNCPQTWVAFHYIPPSLWSRLIDCPRSTFDQGCKSQELGSSNISCAVLSMSEQWMFGKLMRMRQFRDCECSRWKARPHLNHNFSPHRIDPCEHDRRLSLSQRSVAYWNGSPTPKACVRPLGLLGQKQQLVYSLTIWQQKLSCLACFAFTWMLRTHTE